MIQFYKIENEDFQHNGDHILFPTKCELDINLNGSWILDIEVPINYEVAEDWNSGAIVSAPTPYGTQLFRLENIDKTDYYLTGSAYPVFLDAGNEVFLEDVRPTGKTGQEALNIMLSGSKFAAESNITTANTAYYVRKNFLEALSGDDDQAFLNRWGGEVLYDNFKIKVYDRVGGDYGFRAEFGKNINGISIKIDNSELITRIYPIAYNGVMLSTDKKYIDSPRIGNYPVVYTSLQKFESLKLEADAQSSEEGYTQEELNLTLRKEVQKLFDSGVDIPKMTVEIDIISLSETPEYKEFKFSEDVKLGDTVTCTYDPYNLEFQARTIRVLYDCILERNLSITIGSYKYDYFTQLDKDHNKIESTIRPDGTLMAEKVQGILNGIYTQLRLQSTVAEKVEGRVFIVEDTDPGSDLYGCMVWGTQGLQIAVQRTADGRDWDFTTAITAKGIVADAIITGILSDKSGRNYWNLDTGEFRLSGDAFKVDGQTVQDYVDGKIDDKLAQIRTLTMQLSNEFQGIATDSEGSNGDYTECYTDVKVFIGTTDITNSEAVEYDISPSIGITGSWNDVLKRYKVDYLATDNGYVEIVAFYANLAISKRFSISKTKQGSTGLPGQDGVDGKQLYTWLKYADTPTSGMSDDPAGKKYIGLAYNKETPVESSNYSDYQWSLVKGTDGVPGQDGVDGKTMYTWIKYATSASGANMSEFPDGKTFIGIAYNKETATESSDPKVYTWALIKGEDGVDGKDGVAGKDGADGKTTYFHVKYSSVSNPTTSSQMTETPAEYIGTYVDFTQADSSDPTKYTWTKFMGEDGVDGKDGIPGKNGADGKTSYLHIKYSDDGGITFTSNNGETPGKYIGQYVDFMQVDSTDVNSYTWSLAKGADGRSYMLQADTLVIKQGADDVYSPKSVTFTAFYRDGTSAERTNYSGRFIVSETTDGTNYVQKYKSSSNEHSHIHTPTSNNVKNIRCILYAAGGTTQTLDMQGVAIVRDVDNLTQSEVFNILTNNGKLQGIFMKDGQLYINGTYIAVSDWSELSKTLSGFKLSTKRIYGQSEDYCNGMSTGVDNIYAFWAGETNEKLGSGNTDAPYKVSRNGTVWAKRLYAGNVFDFYDDTATWKGDLLNIFREDGTLKIKQNHHTNGKTILMLDQAGGEAQLVFNYAGSPHGTVYFYSGYNSSTYVGMYHKERNNGAGGVIWRYHTDGKFHIDASTVANAIECTTLTQTSTEKAKKDIRVTNPDEALQIIKNSRVFNYTLKGFEDLGEQTGLIIERDCPEEIVTPDGTAINLYSYVSIVCNALKALSKQVDFCTNKIDILSKMRKDRGGYSMYGIIKSTIESRNFVVSDIKNKVDTLWIEGVLTSEQREELIQLISEYANPDTQAPELESLIAIVLQEIETIKDRIEKLEGGNETGTEQPNIIPEWKAWDGVSSEYQPGAVVTHNGKYYQNALDIQNTWEPGGEGIDERFWKEITKEEAEKTNK